MSRFIPLSGKTKNADFFCDRCLTFNFPSRKQSDTKQKLPTADKKKHRYNRLFYILQTRQETKKTKQIKTSTFFTQPPHLTLKDMSRN